MAAKIPLQAQDNHAVHRILEGTLRVLNRRGRRKLSMSDIADEAGVSRGTLYRYFKSKEEVLEAVGEHVRAEFERTVWEAVSRPHPIEERIRVVLKAVLNIMPNRPHVLEIEPNFALDFLRRNLPGYVQVTRKALAPALERLPVVADGTMTDAQIAEIFMRLIITSYLLPSPKGKDLALRLGDMLESFVTTPKAGASPRR